MKVDLSRYSGMKICAAVSGGRDSMALLHYLYTHAVEFGITISALNFDHKMRGEASALDSAFVARYCSKLGIPLLFFEWTGEEPKTESSARCWRLSKYAQAVLPQKRADGGEWAGCDVIATAHHLNDNAETVLFNLARGSGLSGLCGISDEEYAAAAEKPFKIIRPLISCARSEIDEYIAENDIPYVDDQTNFTDGYTRNKIRHNVLPELEKAVPGAAKAIYRFSRIAAEDEEFFANCIARRGLIKRTPYGFEIARCEEKPLFKRALLSCFGEYGIKDYTSDLLERLYALQFGGRGKKLPFGGYTFFNEGEKLAFCPDGLLESKDGVPFRDYLNKGERTFSGSPLLIYKGEKGEGNPAIKNPKELRFDWEKIPPDAVIRFMREGDKFTKFGGGTKNLGSYFTDLKIPARLRGIIPLVAAESEALIVCGVEISEKVRIDGATSSPALCIAEDYKKMSK